MDRVGGRKASMGGASRALAAVLGAAVLAAAVGLVVVPAFTTRAEPATGEFAGFEGGFLVASDADQTATAYADGVLERVRGVEDALTEVSFPAGGTKPEVARLGVSNSVQGWPSGLAVAPDGETAFVAEIRASPPPGVERYDDIDEVPAGRRLFVVDLGADLGRPRISQEVRLRSPALAISVSPDGGSVLAGLKDGSAAVLPFEGGRLGGPSYSEVGSGAEVAEALWHPSGRFVATIVDGRSVRFFELVERTGRLRAVGRSLSLGTELSEAYFSGDGRYLIATDTMWWGDGALGNLLNPDGRLYSIRFDPEGGRHEIVSRARVGLSPEGLAVSPDGSLLVTVNMRRTYLPDALPVYPGRARSSLSLVSFNRDTGELTTLGEYFFEGLLPEDAVFDRAGRSLAVTIYNYREEFPRKGAIEFWNVAELDGEPALERTGYTVPTVCGPHTLATIPRPT